MEDCVAEFGDAQCTKLPQLMVTPLTPKTPITSTLIVHKWHKITWCSFFMPLMAGYMMGRLMGGGAPPAFI